MREAGVYSEIRPYDLSAEAILAFGATGVILSGGPESVVGEAAPEVAEAVLELGVPILGICYGMQALAAKLGLSAMQLCRPLPFKEGELPSLKRLRAELFE